MLLNAKELATIDGMRKGTGLVVDRQDTAAGMETDPGMAEGMGMETVRPDMAEDTAIILTTAEAADMGVRLAHRQ